MKVSINTHTFVNNFLSPVSKLAENLLLKFEQKGSSVLMKTFVASADNSVILMSESECQSDDTKDCVIPDCKTFLRLFSGIEEETANLTIDSNTIKYKSSNNFSFKYHLLDESYLVQKKSFSEAKLKALEYQTKFKLTKQKFAEIIKFNSIIPDAEKLYFYTENSKVLIKVGDEQKSSTNEIITECSSSYSGADINVGFPLDVKNILLFSFNENEITISINHALKIFKFESGPLTYIVSGLVK